jgi:hypothetical protein
MVTNQNVIRRRCGWCPDKAPLDGLGPIPDGALVSDGLCPSCASRLHADMDARRAARLEVQSTELAIETAARARRVA